MQLSIIIFMSRLLSRCAELYTKLMYLAMQVTGNVYLGNTQMEVYVHDVQARCGWYAI